MRIRLGPTLLTVCSCLLLIEMAAAQSIAPPMPPENVASAPVIRLAEEPAEEEEDEIETDRDSFTPAATVVGRRRLIVESAYSFIDNRRTFETHSLPELITRYGITERIELRLGWNYEVGGESNSVSSAAGGELDEDAELERESEISYGLKTFVSEQDGWVPQSSFIVQAATPTSGRDTDTQLITTYVIGWQLPRGCKWDTSFRYSLDKTKDDRFNLWSPSTVLKVPLTEQWNAHAEYFGIFSSGRERDSVLHYFSPGTHYLITRNFEVGLRVGWGLNTQASNFFSNVGVGLRY